MRVSWPNIGPAAAGPAPMALDSRNLMSIFRLWDESFSVLSLRITVRVFTGLSFQQTVLLTPLAATLARSIEKCLGTGDLASGPLQNFAIKLQGGLRARGAYLWDTTVLR